MTDESFWIVGLTRVGEFRLPGLAGRQVHWHYFATDDPEYSATLRNIMALTNGADVIIPADEVVELPCNGPVAPFQCMSDQ